MDRRCWIAGLVLIWASVAFITVGTHLQTLSPGFAEFQQNEIASQAGTDGEEKLNPAGRMALVLSFTWEFAFCSSGFFAIVFTIGVLMIRAIGQRSYELALMAAGVFVIGCLFGALLGLGEALRNFQWGFVTLGVGYLLSAAGLGIGSLGVVLSCRTKHCT